MQACVFVTGVSTIQHPVGGNRQPLSIQQGSKAKLQSQFFNLFPSHQNSSGKD